MRFASSSAISTSSADRMPASMQGKTVVITGATSGMGEAAALELAREGARLVLIARDSSRAAATLQKLKLESTNVSHSVHYADLSRIADMKRVALEISAAESKIDVLINNAGAAFASRRLSADGLEMTFATNHLAYFVVTNILLERLKAAPAARIVSTASDAHRSGRLDLDDLQSEKRYSTFRAYGTSKLCNILFTRELARRLAATPVTANCLHPGFVNTRIGDNNRAIAWIARLVKLFGLSPEDGAKTIIYLAASPEVAHSRGGYFYQCKPATPTTAAQNDEDARRLWDVSEKLAELR
jgi:NAD(P)-dependent dehydrogenase (short-subunit alcohol dehydrogenase family)